MRREIDFTVTAEGRDKGKTFHIVEAPAAQVEWWAVRAFSALEKAGVDVGAYAERGVQGLIVLGVRGLALLPPHELKPLLDEMFACVTSVKPDPRNPQVTRPIVNMGGEGDDIEEFATRFTLRQQIAELHVGFSLAGDQSNSANSSTTTTSPASSNTPTSPARSPRRFRSARQPSQNSTRS
jgi:hypothetical protein